jgi:hypothetical protein
LEASEALRALAIFLNNNWALNIGILIKNYVSIITQTRNKWILGT